jgi:hypothetical protein
MLHCVIGVLVTAAQVTICGPVTDVGICRCVSCTHGSNPKGCAFLWVKKQWRETGGHKLSPYVVSHGTGAGFLSDFIWDGCR